MPKAKVVITVDIGSSSVRCSAYSLRDAEGRNEGGGLTNVQALDNCFTSRTVRSVQPNTGKIHLSASENDSRKSLMENVDDCIDELLEILRQTQESFQVVAVGFSCFVMNMVGVDKEGSVVGEEASISYACNSPTVAECCRKLRR
jgi:gluconokinase